jgi:hypothetical protein
MLTIAEVPSRLNNEKSVSFSANPFTYLPLKNSVEVDGKELSAKLSVETNTKRELLPTDDFSYLKFDVSDYVSNYEAFQIAMDEPSPYNQQTFDYLKFNVSDYVKNEGFNTLDSIDSQEKDFNYLKFDVTKYAATENQEEAKADDNERFGYLKFEATKFNSQEATAAGDFGEMPTNE